MNAPNRVVRWIGLAWPRIWTERVLHPANMDVPHAMGRPILAAGLRSPIRFPGVKPQRTDSVITVQSRLRGLPYFDALTLDNVKRQQLNLRVHSLPPERTGTKRQ